MATDFKIYDLPNSYGDGQESVIIVPICYPCVRFRVRVGKGWGDDGGAFGPHDATLREYLDEIIQAIEDNFDLRELAGEFYDLTEEDVEEWDLFCYDCRWYEEEGGEGK